MPYQTIPETNVRYALLAFDRNGNERADDPNALNGKFSNRILDDVKASPPTNIFLFSHGWRGDVESAIDQYNRWIKAMDQLQADKDKMGPAFRPLWIGVHWPSEAWGQESLGGGSFGVIGQDLGAAKERYALEFGDTPEVRQCLEIIFKEQEDNAAALVLRPHVTNAYNRLAQLIGYVGTGPGSAPEAEGKPFDPEAAFEAASESDDFGGGGFGGALLFPLRTLTFWTMKFRARTIGEGELHDFIASLQNALPDAGFHIMGHSFGCVVVSSLLGGKGGQVPLPRSVDSLALVQGALSLWAYADHVHDNQGGTGYFNRALRHPVVRGPIIVTRSKNDSAVGVAYPAAVALAVSDPSFAPETLTPSSLPLYGGIGTFGIRSFQNLNDLKMLPAAQDYSFKPGNIYNLVADDFIPSHSGIDGPEVAHAIWQAALSSAASRAGTSRAGAN